MRFNWLRCVALLLLIVGWENSIKAQGYSFNCVRDTILPGCPANLCFTLKGLIPDPHRQSNNYAVNNPTTLPSCLLASSNPGIPGQPTTLNIDDRYSPVFPIGFPFIFFGTPNNSLVVSSNGYLSFDLSVTGNFSHFNIINGGTPQDLPSNFYDRALIMGPYHDIDVAITTSPTRLISYQTTGLAPYRTWTITYFKIPLFSAACNSLIENTHQITLYESTGIIDVNIYDKQICTGWNQGRAMVGVQNFARDVGVMVPGRRASDPPWGSIGMFERYRFVPIGGTPLFRRVELYNMAGALVSTGTTVQLPNGDREASFPNICVPPGTSTQYVIKAFYDKIDDPTVEIFGTDTVRVDRSQGLAAATTTSAASCGMSNGVINVINASGGTAPYEYSIDGTTWQTSSTFNGLPGGTHTIYIRDAGGVCTATYTATINVISNLTAVTNNTATTCSGVNNGTIVISSCTGIAPFTYSLDAGAFQSGALPYTFNNLAPGNHTVVVRDASGCITNTISVNITTGTGISATSTVTNTACSANNGSITITASAGVAPYTYQLGAAAPQTSNVFTGLAAGTYTITVRDNIGCTRTVTRTVTSSTVVLATTAPVAATCTGATDGRVTVTPTNGTGPYTFVLDGVTTQTGATNTVFTNLSTGSHTVVITDNPTGCVSNTITFNIGSGSGFTIASLANGASCSGANNGSITVTASSGTGTFTYSVDGGPGVTGPSPFTITNVAAGTHTVTATNSAGCVSVNTNLVTVAAGPAFTTTVSKTDALCNGGATGIITVAQPTTGVAPYQYSLDGTTWQASNIFPGLAAGNYTVYYRESNGCQNSQTITVGESSTVTASNTFVPVVCNGQSNGIITITAGGGIAPYQYSIDGGTTWQNSNVFNVAAGTHTIITRDANNCSTPQTIIVTEPAPLAAASVNGQASCDGGNDGRITVTANGGNAGYQYSIDATTFQASNVFNVGPGNYTVSVRDNLGCTTSFNTTVSLGSNFTMVRQRDTVICEGTSTQLSLASNATQYSWSPATALSSTTVPNPVANPVTTTQYIVTATLGRCSDIDTVMVNVNAAPIPNAGPDGFICYGQTHQLQASGGTVYSWSPNTYLDNPSVPNPISAAGRDITYTLSILSDINGCASLTTDQIRIDVTPPIKVRTFPYDTIGYTGDQFQLLAVPSDNDVIDYVWTPSVGLSDSRIPNPLVTVGATGDVTTYKVTTSTIAGCKGEGYVTIRVYKGPDIYVPSGFTPNGDGKNDRFTPFPVGVKSYNYFNIYNRWGQLVFSSKKLHDGWDGKLGGRDQQSGVFVWMIEGVTNDGRVITKKGTIALIR